MEKQKIFLNGMEFIAEPYSFPIFLEPKQDGRYYLPKTILKDGEYLYGSLFFTGKLGAGHTGFFPENPSSYLSFYLNGGDEGLPGGLEYQVPFYDSKPVKDLFFDMLRAQMQMPLYFTGLKLRLVGDFDFYIPQSF